MNLQSLRSEFLGICVGNSSTRLGTFAGGTLTDSHIAANSDPTAVAQMLDQALADLDRGGEPAAVIATVNPDQSSRIDAQLRGRLSNRLFHVEEDLPIPIGRQLDPEAIIGQDRLLNAAAAYEVLQQACVVVDAGTAITVDYIDGAGTYHGGAIAPGVRLMLEALHAGTAQLPRITWQKPREPIGHNTTEAIRTGIFHCLRGLVHEMVEQYATIAGAFPMVVVTGGDSPMLFKDDPLVDRRIPHLTLLGIGVTVRVATGNGPGRNGAP